MGEIVTIIILSLLLLAQAVERYFFAKHMTEELSKCLKAVMSRNINEYIAATTADKEVPSALPQNEDIALDEATDEDFIKAIQEQTKK
jgi:hypothetical protein